VANHAMKSLLFWRTDS